MARKLSRRSQVALVAAAAAIAAAALLLRPLPTPKKDDSAISRHQAGQVRRMQYQGAGQYLTVEVLADDLLHFELAAATGPAVDQPILTTPMVDRKDYPGPSAFTEKGSVFETADLKVSVDTGTLCVSITDKRKQVALTTTCPSDLTGTWKGLAIAPETMEHVYGLGEEFITPGEPDGDWTGRKRSPGLYGNVMAGFNRGSVGNAQFPVMYAVGPDSTNYALFLDDIYSQRWDFREAPWKAETSGEVLRWYLLSGADLPDLRQDYMALTGRPPVPPRQMFGLWVSEYGYDNWAELASKLATLKEQAFPLDGFVLDLQWFGGITGSSDETSMGRVAWDTTRFPGPRAKLAELRSKYGLGIMTIEESYIGKALPEHADLAAKGYLVREGCATCPPVYLTKNPWWGKGSMLDWTNPAAGDYWHDLKRQPIINDGVMAHWTDLGEPEMFDPKDWVAGVAQGKHAHADYHNLYNFLWTESIFRGYQRNKVAQRPFILSRSGTAGIQRFGVAMWSGDIGANLSSLATHFNAQMHMSLSGVDYFGSDIGGFHRGSLTGEDLDAVYTVWFANGMLFDVPARPHTENLCNCKETAPDRVGHLPSNLANARLRYELIPYLYSLAHRANLYGEALMPPPAYYYQNDANLRENGSLKLIGRDLLAMAVADEKAEKASVYLPAGTWVNYHSNQVYQSKGQAFDVPLRINGIFRLPLFARAGAIIPRMQVDAGTLNALGQRTDGVTPSELVVRVYPELTASAFTLFEDDGQTTAYLTGALQTTEIGQQQKGNQVTVTVKPSAGTYAGAPSSRATVVELVGAVSQVAVNGQPLPRLASQAEFAAASSGWVEAGGGLVLAKVGALPVSQEKRFDFTLR